MEYTGEDYIRELAYCLGFDPSATVYDSYLAVRECLLGAMSTEEGRKVAMYRLKKLRERINEQKA